MGVLINNHKIYGDFLSFVFIWYIRGFGFVILNDQLIQIFGWSSPFFWRPPFLFPLLLNFLCSIRSILYLKSSVCDNYTRPGLMGVGPISFGGWECAYLGIRAQYWFCSACLSVGGCWPFACGRKSEGPWDLISNVTLRLLKWLGPLLDGHLWWIFGGILCRIFLGSWWPGVGQPLPTFEIAHQKSVRKK